MLKIKRNKCKDSGVKFGSLKVGELFTHSNFEEYDNNCNTVGLQILMKTDGSYDDDNNFVALDDGQTGGFEDCEIVHKITGELTITSGRVN
jgi:hypothetical protein